MLNELSMFNNYIQIFMCGFFRKRINMKQARPWMLVNLKIICRFHAHPVHQNSVDTFGPRYVGDDFLGSKLVSFNQTLVPYEIS
jgi:hypothetical protein